MLERASLKTSSIWPSGVACLAALAICNMSLSDARESVDLSRKRSSNLDPPPLMKLVRWSCASSLDTSTAGDLQPEGIAGSETEMSSTGLPFTRMTGTPLHAGAAVPNVIESLHDELG